MKAKDFKIQKILKLLALALIFSTIGREINKIKIPLPNFDSPEQLGNIKPRQLRIRQGEVDLGTQEGFNIALDEIKKGDDKHQAKLSVGELGHISYKYYRKEGEPPKTAEELDKLVENKKSYQQTQQKLADLISTLSELDVLVVLGKPNLKGAAAEWDPNSQTIRITPSSLENGSESVLKILNHETVHVAQSCENGGINYKPKALGVELSPTKIYSRQLGSDIYSQIGEKTKRIEAEAYSYEYSYRASKHFLLSKCVKGTKSASK
jgi:hypothetical protein